MNFPNFMNTELQKIIEKAHSLYMLYGIKSISMDDISRELGMSKKTLYQHIKDKKDLINKVINFERTTQTEKFEEIYNKGENAIDQMIQVNSFIKNAIKDKKLSFEYDLEKYFPEIHQKLSKIKQKGMFEGILKNIERGKKEGIYRQNLNSEIIAGLYVTRFSSSHFFNFMLEHEEKGVSIHSEIMVYHIRGLANAEGIKILEKKIKNNEI